MGGGPIALNPLLSQFNDVDKDLVSLLFNGLTALDARGDVIPSLAERWEVQDGGRTYLFRLRDDVQWHDGVPLVADDVVYTVRTLQDPAYSGFPDLAELWRQFAVEKVDERTVRFRLRTAFAPFLAYATMGVLPSHRLAGVTAGRLPDSDFNTNPIGTGPFRFEAGSAGYVELSANPLYFRGSPLLSRVRLRFFHDEMAALAALEREEVQGVLLRPPAATAVVPRLRRANRWQLLDMARPSTVMLFLNQSRPPFQEVAVRKAVSLALDRTAIVRLGAGGQGLPARGPLVAGTWVEGSALPELVHDPAMAGRVLDEAGWRRGPDGVRERAGQRLSFTIITDNDPRRVSVMEESIRELRAVGIDASPSAAGFTGLIQDFLVPRRFQAIIYGLDGGYDPDAYPVWHSSQIKEDGFNFASLADRQIDDVLERARVAGDRADRVDLYRDFAALFLEKMPSVPLYHPLYTYVLDPRVRQVQPSVLFEPASRFLNVHEWYLRPKP